MLAYTYVFKNSNLRFTVENKHMDYEKHRVMNSLGSPKVLQCVPKYYAHEYIFSSQKGLPGSRIELETSCSVA